MLKSKMSRGARPKPIAALFSFATFAVVACLAFACGPSYQAIHEGDARFEHCYAIDEGAAASMDDKSHCWHDYREHYSFGQARDRLNYAARREQLLARSQAIPTDEAMMEAAPGQVAVVPNAPAPTNAFIPPPQMLQPPQPTPPQPTAAVTAPIVPGPQREPSVNLPRMSITSQPASQGTVEAPGASCANHCSDSWRACQRTCGTGPATAAKAGCEQCTKSHRTCMAACFR
jgi:hypothetical protein